MPEFVELKTFYKNLKNASEPVPNEIGNFNIFKVEDLLLPKHKSVTYSRRNFYKVSLVTGHSKIHYADQCIEILDSVLVFTNPMIPIFGKGSAKNIVATFAYLPRIFLTALAI
jgi:AraC family transcriptional activator of pobA